MGVRTVHGVIIGRSDHEQAKNNRKRLGNAGVLKTSCRMIPHDGPFLQNS